MEQQSSPLSGGKMEQVQRMFNRIAPTYDRLNAIISFGMCYKWRRKGIEMLALHAPVDVLDVATGTGDLAIEMHKLIPSIRHIRGVDISDEMMRIGEQKVQALNLDQIIKFEHQDCTELSYEDNSFDAVTIAFGIRNFADIPQAAKEIYRVLRPGKAFMILELTEPVNPILKAGYKLYSRTILPFIGRLISKDKEAYSYLPESISRVPQREQMSQIFREAGFSETYYHSIWPGTCTIYMGVK